MVGRALFVTLSMNAHRPMHVNMAHHLHVVMNMLAAQSVTEYMELLDTHHEDTSANSYSDCLVLPAC